MGPFEKRVDTLTENVAKTILQQIKSQDRLALMSWGVRNPISHTKPIRLPMPGDPIGVDHSEYTSFGPGVQFDVRNTKLGRGGRIYVALDRSDTYTVIGGKITRKGGMPVWVTKEVHDGIYWDSLVSVIDKILGG